VSSDCKNFSARLPAKIVGFTPVCRCGGKPHFGMNLEVQGELHRLLVTVEDLASLCENILEWWGDSSLNHDSFPVGDVPRQPEL
jgi:hypothetical protein